MACADINMEIQGAEEAPGPEDKKEPLINYYQASEIMLDAKGPLHDLLQKQPAVLGSLQMMCGLLSVGVGVLFALTQEMAQSLFTLFRLSHLTGSLFIIAGLLSNLLFKYPRLLPVCFFVNCGCITVAAVAAALISTDLAHWNPQNKHHLKIETLQLLVLGLEAILSVVLCFWFWKERPTKGE
uniref:uncharacterized protein n=1 Tax=Centroberyx gerrardi TaxID=166262 RepID=UPI003AB0995D